VGAPEDDLLRIPAFAFIMNNVFLGGSAIGSPKDISEMLDLAAKHNIEGWVEARHMREANKAVIDMVNGLARYWN
jgi:alcohol dehydrogenase (NADP+)